MSPALHFLNPVGLSHFGDFGEQLSAYSRHIRGPIFCVGVIALLGQLVHLHEKGAEIFAPTKDVGGEKDDLILHLWTILP